MDDPDPSAAHPDAVRVIRGWLLALAEAGDAGLGPDDGLHAAPLPPAMAHARPADFAAASFRFTAPHLGRSDPGRCLVHVCFAPSRRRHALLARQARWPGALLWLDGHPRAVPRDAAGAPLADAPGHWADDRFYGVPVGGLWEHPLHDVRRIATLGTVFALLACDADDGTQQVLRPRDDQPWTAPRLVLHEGRLHLQGDRLQAPVPLP